MDTTISRHCAQWCAMGGARQSWPASRAHCCHTYTTESQAHAATNSCARNRLYEDVDHLQQPQWFSKS